MSSNSSFSPTDEIPCGATSRCDNGEQTKSFNAEVEVKPLDASSASISIPVADLSVSRPSSQGDGAENGSSSSVKAAPNSTLTLGNNSNFTDVVAVGGEGSSTREITKFATSPIPGSSSSLSAGASSNGESSNSFPDDGLYPDAMFGQFRIIRYIGGGGMGHVYEGVDVALERKVAIKVLPKRRASDATVVARFLNEAKSAARLNHENIAQVYLFGNVDGIPYIAFEFVEGVNLRDYVRTNGVLPISEAIDYMLQTASALAHAAAHGVTHRDVKPSNIIVTPQNRVKLIDMGLARLLKTEEDGDLTESGVTLGTFDYISPEQAKDPRIADVRSDVYSLGCTFFYILTGSPPYPDGTMLQKLLSHQGNETPDVRDANPSVPFEIAAVVRKMMRKNPEDRYQTPGLLIKDLLQIVDLLGLDVDNRGLGETPSSRQLSHILPKKALPAFVASFMLIAIVLTFVFFERDSDLVIPTIESPTPKLAHNGSDDGRNVPVRDPLIASDGNSTNKQEGSFLDGLQPSPGESDTSFQMADYLYDPASLDLLYAAGYNQGVDAAPMILSDSALEEQKTYLSASLARASSARVAFGWRAFGFQPSEGNPSSEMSCASISASVVDTSTSLSCNSYSLLGMASESTDSKAPAASSVRIVDGLGEGSNCYATLQAALASIDATSTEPVRVELKFNDKLETPPISLLDCNVDVRASEGYRPKLVFKASSTPDGGRGERMFLVDSSHVQIEGVEISFTVPSQDVVSSEWSVFETLGSFELEIRNSILTVCNMTGDSFTSPLHSNVTFFRSSEDAIASGFDSQWLTMENPTTPLRAGSIQIDGSLVRGEATLFVLERPGGRFSLTNSGFNISGSLLQYVESEQIALPDVEQRFSLTFDHVVGVGRSPLVKIDAEGSWSGAGSQQTPLLEDSPLTQRLSAPYFKVVGSDSIISLSGLPLAQITSPFLSESMRIDREWNFTNLLAFDVSAFIRSRSLRGETWQERPINTVLNGMEYFSLKDLSAEAANQIAPISPHSFTAYDFVNWLLTPIGASSGISPDAKESSDSIKKVFVENFLE
ncbi:MAG: serine/threonine protein kinase [Thermoguttaceae bacterium]